MLHGTFLYQVSNDDLATSLAGLLHREGGAEALLMLAQALTLTEAIFLHDLMRNSPAEQT